MKHEAPKFWVYPTATWQARLLSPLSALYSFLTKLRFDLTTPYVSEIPVICVGNFTMGGAGKTPVTLSLYQQLLQIGCRPCILSRGYGGSTLGPHRVNIETDTPGSVGDEPFMMAKYAPIIISRNRIAGAKRIKEDGFDCILMDDGFQNPTLHKDHSFIVIDAGSMIGNGCVFPAGPLREPLSRGLKRSDAIIIIGDMPQKSIDVFASKPILQSHIHAKAEENTPRTVFAFAGIGRPQKFYDSLMSCGFSVLGHQDFPDHHPYGQEDLENLNQSAKDAGASLITTEKDWVKLPASWQKKINYLPISLRWQDIEKLKILLESIVSPK